MIKYVFIFLLLLINNSFSEIRKIDISGNIRVSAATIENLVNKRSHITSDIWASYKTFNW